MHGTQDFGMHKNQGVEVHASTILMRGSAHLHGMHVKWVPGSTYNGPRCHGAGRVKPHQELGALNKMRTFTAANLVLEPTINPFSLDNDTPTKSIFSFEDLVRTPATPMLGISHFKMSEAFNLGSQLDISGEMQPPSLSTDCGSEPPADDELLKPYLDLENTQDAHQELFKDHNVPKDDSTSYPDPPSSEATVPDEWLDDVFSNQKDTTDYSATMNEIQGYVPSHHAMTSPGIGHMLPMPPVAPIMAQPFVPTNIGSFPVNFRRENSTLKPHKMPYTSPKPARYAMEPMDLVIPLPPISPEEAAKREQAREKLKKALQSVKLTPFQARFIGNDSARLDPLMTARNKKPCKKCNIVFSTSGRYAFHYEDHGCKTTANGAPREFCEVENCPYKVIGFSCRQSYCRHRASVHEGTKHTCKNCGRVFARKDGLRRHALQRCCTTKKERVPRKSAKE